MFTSTGILTAEITAQDAAEVARRNPYNRTKVLRADIMLGIRSHMVLGGTNYWLQMRDKQLDQDTINWLVSLGFLVWHNTPFKSSTGRTDYSYCIYWMFPDDIKIEPFSPGERWSDDYPRDQSGAV